MCTYRYAKLTWWERCDDEFTNDHVTLSAAAAALSVVNTIRTHRSHTVPVSEHKDNYKLSRFSCQLPAACRQ